MLKFTSTNETLSLQLAKVCQFAGETSYQVVTSQYIRVCINFTYRYLQAAPARYLPT